MRKTSGVFAIFALCVAIFASAVNMRVYSAALLIEFASDGSEFKHIQVRNSEISENTETAISEDGKSETDKFEETGTSYELYLLHEGKIPRKKNFSFNAYETGIIIENALFAKDDFIELEFSEGIDNLIGLYELVINSEPELFYVADTVKVVFENERYLIYPQYKSDFSLLGYDDGAEFKKEVENILSYVTDEMSDLEKALAVHDYMVRNYEYDYTYENSDINEIFLEKKGVCQAYADAYTYIMQKKLGINCYTLSSRDLNHAWNVIMIDGQWYHVDVTWDDPTFGGRDYFGAVRHSYFLISSNVIRDGVHGHDTYDWELSEYALWKYDFDFPDNLIEPSSERFDNYVWTDTGYSPYIYYNGIWYYIKNGNLYTYDFKSETATCIKQLDYGTNYDVFDIYQDTVIYKGYWENKVILYPLKGSGSRILHELNGAYSFRTKDNYLQYVMPSDKVTVYEVNMDDLSFSVPLPEVSITSGSMVSVYFSNDMEDVKFYYTTDGTVPQDNSDSSDSLKVKNNGDFKIKVIASKSGYNNSGVKTVLISDGIQKEIGDSNGDGVLNRMDLLRLGKYFAGWDVSIEEKASDVTGDGEVNRMDLLRLAKYLSGWMVELG